MSGLVASATTVAVLMLIGAVVIAWVGELRRTGGAVSARESIAAGGRASFYTSREDRAEAMRERIRRERRRRERARAAAGHAPPRPSASGPADRPAAPPPEPPDAVHRAALELGPGPVTKETLRRHYRRLVAAYHPDRVAGLGEKLQRLAEEETKAINQAYAFFKGRLE